jgi:hypothetical protein
VLRNVVAVCMMSGKIQKIHRKKRRQRMKWVVELDRIIEHLHAASVPVLIRLNQSPRRFPKTASRSSTDIEIHNRALVNSGNNF